MESSFLNPTLIKAVESSDKNVNLKTRKEGAKAIMAIPGVNYLLYIDSFLSNFRNVLDHEAGVRYTERESLQVSLKKILKK